MNLDIISILKADEGYSLKVYLCTKGFKTVGTGHNLDANPALSILKRPLKLGDYITPLQAEALFKSDLQNVYHSLDKYIPLWKTFKSNYQIICINMAFQMGAVGLTKFKKMLAAMATDNSKGVITSICNSLYYKQTTNRARRMIQLAQGVIPKEYQ